MLPSEAEYLKTASDLFPMVVSRGFEDYSCSIHSFGVTYWTALGVRLGLMALAEMPAPHFGEAAWKGQDVISDSAWFRRDSERPEVLVEFERYSDEMDAAKLAGKVQNLVLGHWRWAESPRLLVLAYWSKGLRNLPDHQKLRSIVRDGFQTIARESVKGCRNARIVFVQFLFDEAPGNRWKLARVLERGVA